MGPRLSQAAALTALEAIGDTRSIPTAVSALTSADEDVVLAAVTLARRFLRTGHSVAVLDPLAAVVLDSRRSEQTRVAAFEALSDLPAATIAPLVARLRDDPAKALRQAVTVPRQPAVLDASAEIDRAARGGLPAEPEEVVALLDDPAAEIPLSTLHRLVIALREREVREVSPRRRHRWRTARGTVHRVLAGRKSRVALYDLRETLAEPEGELPPIFAEAATIVGDVSCLEPLADAYARVHALDTPSTVALAAALGAAFRAIVRRERIGARHASMARIRLRWPHLLPELRGRRGSGRSRATARA